MKATANLPLQFEANQGQADSRVRFTSHGSGYSLFLTDTEAVLLLGKSGSGKSGAGGARSLTAEPSTAAHRRSQDAAGGSPRRCGHLRRE